MLEIRVSPTPTKKHILNIISGVLILFAFSVTQGQGAKLTGVEKVKKVTFLKEDQKLNNFETFEADLRVTLISLGSVEKKRFLAANVKATWLESLEICHRNGYIAAEIDSIAELNFVKGKLRESIEAQGLVNYFWTGDHDFGSEGVYKWIGTNRNISTQFIRQEIDLKWNCVQISLYQTYLFDYDCRDGMAMPLCQET